MTKEQILQEAKALQEEIKSHRLWLHTHAETGFDLTETKPYVKSTLTEMGYAVHECGKAGLVTTVGKPGGKVILLRADMDALPIAEEADVDFACKNGRMHACGHDMHTAMLLGAAKILKAHESELDGMVKLMFQPAEEIFEGSKDMIASGVLENPRPDAALMIHVAAGMPLPAGTVVVSAPASAPLRRTILPSGCMARVVTAPHPRTALTPDGGGIFSLPFRRYTPGSCPRPTRQS